MARSRRCIASSRGAAGSRVVMLAAVLAATAAMAPLAAGITDTAQPLSVSFDEEDVRLFVTADSLPTIYKSPLIVTSFSRTSGTNMLLPS